MIEFLKRITRWDDIINAVSNLMPHVNRLVLGTLLIVAVFIIVVLVIIFK